jgi:hypothetical protein
MQISVFKLFNFDDKVILNNHGKHVENFANTVTHNGLPEKERELYEKLIQEKDARIKVLEEMLGKK